MSRIAKTFQIVGSLLLGAWLVGHGLGCTHFVETRAINHFMSALETQDLDNLKSVTSGRFDAKALRLDESFEDLNVLKLPEGKAEILHVEDVTADEDGSAIEKNVTVQVGKAKRRLKYKLTKDPNSKKWVVDDVYMKQTQQGLTTAKSVTEQMNLLLTVREFLTAWRQGSPDEIISMTTPEFGQDLRGLSADYLTWLARKTVGKKPLTSKLRSQAQMDEDIAIVRVPTAAGEMAISFRLQDDLWKLSDVSVTAQSPSERIASVRELAKIIAVAVRFLDSYEGADKQSLAGLCTKSFYRGSLMPADLSSVQLPSSNLREDEFEIEVHGKHSDFIVKDETQWLKISLMSEGDDGLQSRYLVEDVTIYELHSQQEKRLSALFTSQAMMQLFSEALIARNLTQLRHSSTPDFNRRVWQKLDQQSIRDLHFEGIEHAQPRLINTDFQGMVSEVWVTQGERAVSYVLHDHDGQLLVNDVHVSGTEGRPSSLKTTLELMIPVRGFAQGIQTKDLQLIQRHASKDFNRLVWQQIQQVPDIGYSVPNYLTARLDSVELGEDQVLLVLGNEGLGAKVSLVKERDRYVIDEIQLIAGPTDQQRAKLKHTLRYQVVNFRKNSLRAKSNTPDLTSPAISVEPPPYRRTAQDVN